MARKEEKRRKESRDRKRQKRHERVMRANNLFLTGYTVWEICEILDLKETTVRSLLKTLEGNNPQAAWEA